MEVESLGQKPGLSATLKSLPAMFLSQMLLSLLTPHHQPETKCSKTRACEGRFSLRSAHPRSEGSVFLKKSCWKFSPACSGVVWVSLAEQNSRGSPVRLPAGLPFIEVVC